MHAPPIGETVHTVETKTSKMSKNMVPRKISRHARDLHDSEIIVDEK